MDRPKWHSKLVHMAVTVALVLSLMGVALSPVLAQRLSLNVTVDTDKDIYCVCDDIIVTANISNPTAENATNVNATIWWKPPGNVSNVTPLKQNLGRIGPNGNWTEATWTLHCDGASNTTIAVNVTSELHDGKGSTNVTQWYRAHLKAKIFQPQADDVIHVCENFILTFQITNNGTAPATSVHADVTWPIGSLSLVGGPCGSGFTSSSLEDPLYPGESHNWTYTLHCCAADPPGYITTIHVLGAGNDWCTGREIPTSRRWSFIVPIHQVYGVTCNATPNPSKVCHNVTFNATVGEGAVYPASWNWTFDDGNYADGVTSVPEIITKNHYLDPGTYNTTITVTDANNITANCSVQVTVFDRLDAACNVTPYNFTKPCHNLTFRGTGVGGFPPGICTYNWTWDFGDNITASGTGYSSGPVIHHYNDTGPFTAVFTIQDDCLNNTANCSVNITVYHEFWACCWVEPWATKVCHNVTFYGSGHDGIPEKEGCTYNWTWDFGDNSTAATGTGRYCNVTHHYNVSDNYTAVFWIQDDCWNNTANCTTRVEVFPGLNLTCNATPRVSHVCHAVNFTANVTGGVPWASYNWTWNFGDPFATPDNPNISMSQNASHIYMCTGNYTATVTVCDDLEPEPNCANCTVTIEVIIEPPELITPPNGTMVLTDGSGEVCFNWTDIGCCNYTLQIWQKEEWGQKIWNINTGKNSTWCVPLMPDYYRWQVIATDMCGEWVVSETWYFGVDMDIEYPYVDVTRPAGGESWVGGTEETITWFASEFTEFPVFGDGVGLNQEDLVIDIYYSVDGGENWIEIATGEANDGVYLWMVPMIDSTQCVIMVVATDEQGNSGNDVSGVFIISTLPVPVPCFNITMCEGWNLISLPLIPDSNNITVVLADIMDDVVLVWYYDAATPAWLLYMPTVPWYLNSLQYMDDGLGYWVSMNDTAILEVCGKTQPDPPELPPTYPVFAGDWNMIGFKSTGALSHETYLLGIAGNYVILWGYDCDEGWFSVYPLGEHGGKMEPGYGYFLWPTADGMIVPPA